MDRLSDFNHTVSFASGELSYDSELTRHVARGRALQRAALRDAIKAVGRTTLRGLRGWGELRLSHPRSRVGC